VKETVKAWAFLYRDGGLGGFITVVSRGVVAGHYEGGWPGKVIPVTVTYDDGCPKKAKGKK